VLHKHEQNYKELAKNGFMGHHEHLHDAYDEKKTRAEIEAEKSLAPTGMKHGSHKDIWAREYEEELATSFVTAAEYDPDGDGVPGEARVAYRKLRAGDAGYMQHHETPDYSKVPARVNSPWP